MIEELKNMIAKAEDKPKLRLKLIEISMQPEVVQIAVLKTIKQYLRQ